MFGFMARVFGNAPSKPARGRGPAKTAREMAARRRLRFMADLQLTDPAKYHEVMLRECGMGGDDGKIDMAQVLKVIDYLKQIGLKVVPSRGGTDLDDDSLRSWIKDLAPVFGPALAQAMGGRQPQANATAGPSAVYRVLPPDQPAALPSAQPTTWTGDLPMTLVSRYLIGQLDGKSPADAAAWLLAQPQAVPLAGRLKDTPDLQIPALLDELATQAPDYVGFVAWLKARPDWTIQTVHEIRAQSGASVSPPQDSMGI